jgi:hypothetical protein
MLAAQQTRVRARCGGALPRVRIPWTIAFLVVVPAVRRDVQWAHDFMDTKLVGNINVAAGVRVCAVRVDVRDRRALRTARANRRLDPLARSWSSATRKAGR